MATKVKLRQKKISGKRKSLYLDFYPAITNAKTGQLTRREFLGLYVYENAKTVVDKFHNKETLQLAEQIRQKRDNQINKPEIYTEYEREQLKLKEIGQNSFVEYFKKLAHKRKASNHDNWISALNYLEKFTNNTLRFSDVTEKFCNDFKEYLLSTKSIKSDKVGLSQNSAVSYFNKLKAALKQAYKDGFFQADINRRIESIRPVETKRSYLTLDELNKLVKAPCHDKQLKTAALFSALTGLRFSDIAKLKWSEIEHINGQGYLIHFKQKKTKGIEVLPISEQAYGLLGTPKGFSDSVFENLTYSAYANKHLYQWVAKAGISKDITFHCFRHTFATLQLSGGTDIYTVSKLLGHRELKTTQVYAKIVDQTKRDAVNKIKIDL